MSETTQGAAATPRRVHLSEFTSREASALQQAASTLHGPLRELVDELARIGYTHLLRTVSDARRDGFALTPTVSVLAGALRGAGLSADVTLDEPTS